MSLHEQNALKLLFYPESYPGMSLRSENDVELTLWQNNSLGSFTTWSLIRGDEKFYIRRVIWNQRSTYKLKDPETYCSDTIISVLDSNKIIDALNVILNNSRYSAKQDAAISIDGVNCGIVYKNIKIEWRDEFTKDLYEIGNWYVSAVSYLDSLFSPIELG